MAGERGEHDLSALLRLGAVLGQLQIVLHQPGLMAARGIAIDPVGLLDQRAQPGDLLLR